MLGYSRSEGSHGLSYVCFVTFGAFDCIYYSFVVTLGMTMKIDLVGLDLGQMVHLALWHFAMG